MDMSREKVVDWIENNALASMEQDVKVDVNEDKMELNEAFVDSEKDNDLEIKQEVVGVKLEKMSNNGDINTSSTAKKEGGEVKNIKISIFGVQEIKFTVKKNRNLSLPLRIYSKRLGFPLVAFRFVYDGVRVTEKDTPDSLEMADGDIIEVYKDQLGGDR